MEKWVPTIFTLNFQRLTSLLSPFKLAPEIEAITDGLSENRAVTNRLVETKLRRAL